MTWADLTAVHRTILDCVQMSPGIFTRSDLARLLVGSRSRRVGGMAAYPYYGRLSGHGRKQLTGQIDSLLQQRYLQLDGRQRLILAVPSRGAE